MKYYARIGILLHQLRMIPLTWLNLSWGSQLLLVTFSYVVGISGLWLLFPPTHNGSSMFLPIVIACWLFRYRGLLTAMVLNGIAFQLTYIFLLRGLLPDQAFVVGGIVGFITSLGLGIIVCWLRAAVDQVRMARQRVQAAEQEQLRIHLQEQQIALAYEQQRKINALKDQFLLNVSHELRTPLTVLGGSLEILHDFGERLDPTTRAQYMKHAIESQEDLAALVDRVLDATEIISDIPGARPEAINVRHFLQDVLTQLKAPEIAAYTIHLQLPDQLMVWADPQFLRQVLHNLFSNIFKYVPTRTEIHIEGVQSKSSSFVNIHIRDEGPGIPADELSLIFEKFVRLKRDIGGPTRGTGLGLYICKQLMEAMGGRIWVESSGQPDQGSCFCLSLPAVTSD
ncbi:sensor histidine kinase [Dictyobacter aurantiacus]|uniref:histidine kinase n=1 Tax=Dictyobacter aurantiacus TaxID=1936993 RepID=A0A401ZJ95_9CHLR|nr:ATP-binding protein [Dictyobacter aurantiacus]GCE06912.1 hypothetical protein KDAU_42410 [Dictyobacter aurantiacus]